jgi:hypothetical protein
MKCLHAIGPIHRLLVVFTVAAALTACAADEADRIGGGNGSWNNNTSGSPGDAGANEPPPSAGDGFVPEEEVAFEFAAPAIIGDQVYVANETLNSVAVIDSRNLSVKTVLVGPRPTIVVGPTPEHSTDPAARVMSLNQGNHTVTIIDPATYATRIVPVLSEANALLMDPRGRFALAWYDDKVTEAGSRPGDLSTVTVITAETSFQIAVGFHVRRVQFSESGDRAVVLTDDGISLIELTGLTSDTFSPPVPVVPAHLDQLKPVDLDVRISPDARFAITRTSAYRGLILLDIDANDRRLIDLPESPTDIKLFEKDSQLELLAMLPRRNQMLRATIPDGLVAAADWSEAQPNTATLLLEHEGDAGHEDTSLEDAGFADTDPMDAGFTDTGEADAGADVGEQDAEPGDDASADHDAGADIEAPIDLEPWPQFDGFVYRDVVVPAMGVSGISRDASTALLYTTLNEERRAVLYDLDADTQRAVVFEKGLRGLLPDDQGRTFIVFHSRRAGNPPAGLAPTHPDFIAHSWGFSIVDIASAATRLILTQQEPGQTALWSSFDADEDARVYMIFRHPTFASQTADSHRDIVSVNLRSFRMDTFRVSSLPDGIGAIRGARKIYISQIHPQGRLSFLDVETGERQTITGYQLNAGIY